MSRFPRFAQSLVVALAAAVAASCHDSPTQPLADRPLQSGQLAVYAALPQLAAGTLVVQVSGPGIVKSDGTTPDTLAFNIPVANGVASGSITVPAGPQRVIMVRAYSGVTETHRGSVTTDIVVGTNPTITVTLVPLVGDVPITVSVGTTIVIVRPGVATLGVGDTLRMSAEIHDQNGAIVVGKVRWATLNPMRASVDTAGLVTMRDTGDVQIVATYGTVGGSAKLSGTPKTSAIAYHLTWNGSVSTSWAEPNNWTPHGIGAARAPTAADSVVITASAAKQPIVDCTADVSVRDLTIQAGATLGTSCGYGVNVYRSASVKGATTARVFARPGALLAGVFANLYVYGDTVTLADSVRASYVEVNSASSPNAGLRLAGHTLNVTGDLNLYGTATLSLADPDTLIVTGNVSWNGGDQTGRLAGGVVLYRGTSFYGYKYKASGKNRLVFDRSATGQQTIGGFDNTGGVSALAHWDVRNRDGVAICGYLVALDSIIITAGATPLSVDNGTCGGYPVHAYGAVVTSANTSVTSYLWDLRHASGTSAIAGSWAPTYTDLSAANATIKPGLSYVNLRLYANNAFLGRTTTTQGLVLDGANAATDVALNGKRVTVGGAFTAQNGAVLTMTNAADSLIVAGGASFNADTRVAELTRITAGVIEVGGTFYGNGFNAAGTSKVRLTGTATGTNYLNGLNYLSYDQAFQDLEIVANAQIGLCGSTRVKGTLTVRSGAALKEYCGGSYIRTEGDLVTEATSSVKPYVVQIGNATGTANVAGTWAPLYTEFRTAAAPVKAGLSYANLRFYASNKLLGPTTADSTLLVDGSGVDLNLNGQSLSVGSYATVSTSATLTMQNANDSLDVKGYMSFNSDMSSTEQGKLTAGVMRVGGYFYGYGFSASGTHRVVLTGVAATGNIQAMDYNARPAQQFQNLELAASTTYGLCSAPRVRAILTVRTGATVKEYCGGSTLRVDSTFTTEAGSTVTPYAVALFNRTGTQGVAGTFTPTVTAIWSPLAAGQLKPGLGYASLDVRTDVALSGSLTVNGNLTVQGTGANLTVNGWPLFVKGSLTVNNSGTVTMTNAKDSIMVDSSAYWYSGAGDHTAKLTAGTVIVKGRQFNVGRYYATGTHVTVFDRTGGTVSVEGSSSADPSTTPLNEVYVRNGGATVCYYMNVTGKMHVAAGARVDACSGAMLWVGGALDAAATSQIGNGASGANLTVVLKDPSGTSQILGTYSPDLTRFQGLNASIKSGLGYQNVAIDQTTTLVDSATFAGRLDINNSASFALGGHRLTVNGSLNVAGAGAYLVMTNAVDSLNAGAGDPLNTTFYVQNADHTGKLTNGVVRFFGRTFYGPKFNATTPHKFVFADNVTTGPAITLDGTPTLGRLEIASARTVNIYNGATIGDSLNVSRATTLSQSFGTVQVGGVLASVAGSTISIGNFELQDNSGTTQVKGSYTSNGVTRFKAARPSVQLGSTFTYTNIEVAGSASVAGTGPLTANGGLKLLDGGTSFSVPDGSTFSGTIETNGALTFAGGAVTNGNLNVNAGGRATAAGTLKAVDVNNISVSAASGALAAGALDNSVGTASVGFRYKTGLTPYYGAGITVNVIGPAPSTHP